MKKAACGFASTREAASGQTPTQVSYDYFSSAIGDTLTDSGSTQCLWSAS